MRLLHAARGEHRVNDGGQHQQSDAGGNRAHGSHDAAANDAHAQPHEQKADRDGLAEVARAPTADELVEVFELAAGVGPGAACGQRPEERNDGKHRAPAEHVALGDDLERKTRALDAGFNVRRKVVCVCGHTQSPFERIVGITPPKGFFQPTGDAVLTTDWSGTMPLAAGAPRRPAKRVRILSKNRTTFLPRFGRRGEFCPLLTMDKTTKIVLDFGVLKAGFFLFRLPFKSVVDPFVLSGGFAPEIEPLRCSPISCRCLENQGRNENCPPSEDLAEAEQKEAIPTSVAGAR